MTRDSSFHATTTTITTTTTTTTTTATQYFKTIATMSSQTEEDNIDMDLLLILYKIITLEEELEEKKNALVSELRLQELKRESSIRVRKRIKAGTTKYPSWSTLQNQIPDKIFRRKFRMTKPAYNLLCSKICEQVGESTFQPESICGSGRIPGEVKCGLSIRLLAGGSYLDLIGKEYGIVQPGCVYRIFHQFIDWVNQTFHFPFEHLINL